MKPIPFCLIVVWGAALAAGLAFAQWRKPTDAGPSGHGANVGALTLGIALFLVALGFAFSASAR